MNKNFIVALIAVIICLILLLITGLTNYKLFNKKKYSFLSYFPFELFDKPLMKFNLLVQIMSALFCASLGVFYLYVFNSFDGMFYKVEIFIGIVISLLMFSTFYLRILSDKIHFIVSSLFIIISTLNSFFLGYIALINSYILVFNVLPYILFGICLIELILLLNPKMKNCMKLHTNEKGDLERPRVFYLAFVEWSFIFLNVINVILIAFGIA